jgi:hypothetical protein
MLGRLSIGRRLVGVNALVCFEIVVGVPSDGGVDLQKRLAVAVGFFDVPDVHPTDSLLGLPRTHC